MVDRIDWSEISGLAPYAETVASMEARAALIAEHQACEAVWSLEHPPLYTMGTSGEASELLTPDRFPVFQTGRGGRFTYHGPGQRVLYTMMDLRSRGRDVRAFVHKLEQVVIDALSEVAIKGERREDRVGVWVAREAEDGPVEEKVAAIGVRLRRWVSFHGLAVNVAPDLTHFDGIVPCGVREHGVTSVAALGGRTRSGRPADMAVMDRLLRASFQAHFGVTQDAPPPALAPTKSMLIGEASPSAESQSGRGVEPT